MASKKRKNSHKHVPTHSKGFAVAVSDGLKCGHELTIMWSVQLALDVMTGVLNQQLGVGKDRLVKICEEFNKNFPEYVSALDKNNPEADYVRDKIDRQLEQICGEYFVPWRIRYDDWTE